MSLPPEPELRAAVELPRRGSLQLVGRYPHTGDGRRLSLSRSSAALFGEGTRVDVVLEVSAAPRR